MIVVSAIEKCVTNVSQSIISDILYEWLRINRKDKLYGKFSPTIIVVDNNLNKGRYSGLNCFLNYYINQKFITMAVAFIPVPIFNIDKGILKEISERSIILEKDIQRLVERNMHAILGIEFVTSEFELNGLRVDSLGYDKESSSFTIIEYKRDKNFSVIDQGYAYLALLLNNKAEFILLYNEKNKNPLRKEDLDWSQSRVIFISPSFTTYQRKAIEFKDLPIELWEVRTYSNNTILFNQIQSPEKSESITKISQTSTVVQSVNEQVRVYNEESHFEASSEKIRGLYKELKEGILSIASDVNIKPKARYIAFIHKTNFVDIVVRKSNLTLFLNMKKGTLNDSKNLARDVSNVGHWGNGDYEIIINDSSDIGYALSLIRQSYEKN